MDFLIQNGLAGTDELPDAQHHVSVDASTLMTTSLPVTGDYRQEHYRALVDHAIEVLAAKLLHRPTKNTNMLAKATCCNCFGEKRTIEKQMHPPWKIKCLSKKSKTQIKSFEDLKAAILGSEPADPALPWRVSFPKVNVKCTYEVDRRYILKLDAIETHEEERPEEPQDDATLGKRTIEELGDTTREESSNAGRPRSRRSGNTVTRGGPEKD